MAVAQGNESIDCLKSRSKGFFDQRSVQRVRGFSIKTIPLRGEQGTLSINRPAHPINNPAQKRRPIRHHVRIPLRHHLAPRVYKMNTIKSHKQNRAFPESNDLSLDFLTMAGGTDRANLSNTDLGAFGLDDETGDPVDGADLVKGPPPLDAFFHEGKTFIKGFNHLL